MVVDDEGRLAGHGLIFANKTAADVICEKELRAAFGEQALFLVDRAQEGLKVASLALAFAGFGRDDLLLAALAEAEALRGPFPAAPFTPTH